MIAGHITIEDTTLNFRALVTEDGPAQVTYTVCDAVTGEEETRTVHAGDFMQALGLALSFDGEPVPDSEEFRHRIELVQPVNKDLRFIP
jgi:hypothetical protein